MRAAPSLLGPLRRPAPVIAALAAAVVVVLAWRYRGDAVAGRLDRDAGTVLDALGHRPSSLLADATRFGSPPTVVLCAVLLSGAALLLGRRRLAVLAVAGPGLTGVATTVLKPLIGRTIGDTASAGFAFPSGHTGGAVSIGLVVAVGLVGLLPVARAGPAVTTLIAAALLAGGTVGAGMVRIGAHYATDTVGGFCTAVAIGLSSALVIDRVADRWAARARSG
ncbi:phosphatase PAP2 family protein [Pseudonocardia spirodelae]|uniref:Phosphatase PAP2 family protein n=1 Tax=Pseudonocardia spirodelae TaxID=3133431 RepID=A0ABU8T3E0_9PSEU